VVSYRIDQDDSIAALGDDWVSFAIANDATHLADVTGRSLWDFVSDSTTRQVYRQLLARVRQGRTIRFSYRCDAPSLKRFMQMTMSPAPAGGVTFESATVRTEPCGTTSALPEAGPDHLLRMCGWCKRVAVDGQWEEVECAVERSGVFAGRPPAITHTMCPSCLQTMDDTAAIAV